MCIDVFKGLGISKMEKRVPVALDRSCSHSGIVWVVFRDFDMALSTDGGFQ